MDPIASAISAALAPVSPAAAAIGVATVHLVEAIVVLANVIEAACPQPKPGSHALPIRKIISIAALSIGNGKPGDQPKLLTWVARVLQPTVAALQRVIASMPPPAAQAPNAPAAAPVVPVLVPPQMPAPPIFVPQPAPVAPQPAAAPVPVSERPRA